ncbi:MAG: uroporphyrinogen-III C-methyltransferase [Shewanellaceae bacterium]|nr:uroporphyrinogen-III C-methyltransferase [Shewanellaceae bacterium]
MAKDKKNNQSTHQGKDEKWLSDADVSPLATQNSPEVPSQVTKNESFLVKFAFIFALLALGANGMLYLTFSKQQQQTQRQQTKLGQTLNNLGKVQKFNTKRLESMSTHQANRWLASEALYLLKIADRKISLEHDALTATYLIKDAQQLLQRSQAPEFALIVDSMQQDLKYVKIIQQQASIQVDETINDMLVGLNKIPMLVIPETKPKAVLVKKSRDTNLNWYQNLTVTWHEILADIVTIRHHQGNAPEFVSPEQAWYVKENIRLRLQNAELAFYSQEFKSFQQAITLALQWLQTYSDVNHPQVALMIKNLNKLKRMNLKPAPQLTLHSIAQLEHYFKFTNANPAKGN